MFLIIKDKMLATGLREAPLLFKSEICGSNAHYKIHHWRCDNQPEVSLSQIPNIDAIFLAYRSGELQVQKVMVSLSRLIFWYGLP